MHSAVVILAGLVVRSLAQRPENTSICDYYTAALLKDNTAENQYSVLALLVNTVVIGNCMLLALLHVRSFGLTFAT